MTDFFVGIKGPDFVMVCSDTSAVHSIITIKQDEDKIVPIDSHKLFCLSGEAGDRVQFSEYVIANVKLYALRNATRLSTKSVAHYTRGELAVALRKVGCWLMMMRRVVFVCARAHAFSRTRAGGAGAGRLQSFCKKNHQSTSKLNPTRSIIIIQKPQPPTQVAVPHQPADRRLRRRRRPLALLARLPRDAAQDQHRRHRLRCAS